MPETVAQPEEVNAPPTITFKERVTIVNINHEPIPLIFRTYHAPYQIKSPGPDEEYALTVIHWRRAYIDGEDDEPGRNETRSEFIIGAQEIADDLCREINANIVGARGLLGTTSFWGLFVAKGDTPTREELDEAQRKLKLVMSNLVQMGDIEWSRYHRYELVPDTCRMAARFLKLEKEWAYVDVSQSAECPACGMKLPHKDVAICRSCNAILNRDKAVQFGLVKPDSQVVETQEGTDESEDGEDEYSRNRKR